jgi:hypothetical protein
MAQPANTVVRLGRILRIHPDEGWGLIAELVSAAQDQRRHGQPERVHYFTTQGLDAERGPAVGDLVQFVSAGRFCERIVTGVIVLSSPAG